MKKKLSIAVVEEKKEMDPQILALMEAEEKVQELITVLKKAEVAHANDTCDILVAKIMRRRIRTLIRARRSALKVATFFNKLLHAAIKN